MIKDLTCSLKKGQRLGLIGEEGNGKSTLLKVIAGDLLVDHYAYVEGHVETKHCIIGYFKQEERDYDDCFVVDYLLTQKPEDMIDPSSYATLATIQKMLHRFALPIDLIESNQLFSTLSGGQKVKLQLLKMSLIKPDLLLLDEPTNDLDVTSIGWLIDYLKSLSCTIVCASHDVFFLQSCMTQILHLEQRNKKTKPVTTFYEGTLNDYLLERSSKQEKNLQEANNQKRQFEQKKARLNNIRNAVHDAQNNVSRQDPFKAKALKVKMKSIKAQEKKLANETLLQVDDLEEGIDVFFEPTFVPSTKILFSYDHLDLSIAGKTLIHNASFKLIGHQKIGLTGENGVGKSLLMKKFYQDLAPTLNVAYMPQNYQEHMDLCLSAIDYINHPFAQTLLGRMQFLHHEMIVPMSHISEGQKAKVYLAHMILSKPDIILLDEPTRNISPLNLHQFINIFKSFNGAILTISHDQLFIKEVLDHVYVIEDKTIKQLS